MVWFARGAGHGGSRRAWAAHCYMTRSGEHEDDEDVDGPEADAGRGRHRVGGRR